jgi:hypothetical protein
MVMLPDGMAVRRRSAPTPNPAAAVASRRAAALANVFKAQQAAQGAASAGTYNVAHQAAQRAASTGVYNTANQAAQNTYQSYSQPSTPSYPRSTPSSSGGSSSSGGGGQQPRAPRPAPAPPPPPPPPLDPFNYGRLINPDVEQWLGRLSNDNVGRVGYAEAARDINNNIVQFDGTVAGHERGYRDDLVEAYAKMLHGAGRTDAAQQLRDTGSLDVSILPQAAEVADPAPVMETVVVPDAQSDSLYKQQARDLATQLADFTNDQDLAGKQYTNQYNNVLRKMGWMGDKGGGGHWDPSNTNAAYGQATQDNTDDFVGRGLGWSGLLAKAQSGIDANFNDQKGDIDRQAGDFTDTQNRQRTSFKNKNDQSLQQALADAISRIAAQFGVERNQVGTTVTRKKA